MHVKFEILCTMLHCPLSGEKCECWAGEHELRRPRDALRRLRGSLAEHSAGGSRGLSSYPPSLTLVLSRPTEIPQGAWGGVSISLGQVLARTMVNSF